MLILYLVCGSTVKLFALTVSAFDALTVRIYIDCLRIYFFRVNRMKDDRISAGQTEF